MIDGLVSSHCCVLNSPEWLELVKKSNQIAALMTEIEVNRMKQKEEAQKLKEDAQKKKEDRKQLRLKKKREEEKKAKEVCEQTMKDIAEKGKGHLDKLTVKVLKDLIQFFFKSDEYTNKDHCKPQLKVIAKGLYEEYVLKHGLLFDAGEKRNTNDDAEVLHDSESSGESSHGEEIDTNHVQMV